MMFDAGIGQTSRVICQVLKCSVDWDASETLRVRFGSEGYFQTPGHGDSTGQWPHQYWVELLASRDPLQLGDRAVGAVCDDDGGDESAPLRNYDDPPAPDQQALVQESEDARRPIHFLFQGFPCGRVVKVLRTDSHQSGMPRVWCVCFEHRAEGCVKYRFVHHFENERAAAIWLCA
jgi:hypothetical protein